MQILPAMNVLWFWFDKKTRRDLHGTPEDVMRKFQVLEQAACLQDGLEIFLIPSRLKDSPGFHPEFIEQFRQLPYRSVHIGDADPDFLDAQGAPDDFQDLAAVISMLDARTLVIHAHHFGKNRRQRADRIRSALNGCDILIENNGFDHVWGGSAQGVKTILDACPSFNLCLDIAHVNDFPGLSMDAFLSDPVIRGRIREIHYSYSTLQHATDPYREKGFSGYGPFHAMFSVLEREVSRRTRDFIAQYPVVIEGILPKEDRKLDYLKKEVAQIL